MAYAANLRDLKRQNGASIRAMRKLNGMHAPDDLAEAVGLKPQVLRNYESETGQASWEALARMARALSVPLAAITRWPPELEPAWAADADDDTESPAVAA
jgi:transcriptional regulator with XRE-family HTH domain